MSQLTSKGITLRGGQSGLSLVELMVSILIGLIVLAGVIQVMVSSKTVYLGQEDMSYIQENARYALDVIGRDVQNAGHWGCAGSNSTVAFAANVDGNAKVLLGDSAAGLQSVVGFSSVGTAAGHPDLYADRIRPSTGTPQAGNTRLNADSFIVRRAEGPEVPILSHTGSALTLANAAPAITSSRVLVGVAEDCQRFGVFGAGTVTGAVINYGEANCASPKPTRGNSHDCASPGPYEPFLPGSTVMGYAANAYYISDSQIAGTQPALKRQVLRDGAAVEEEIALGVEDMEVLYGIDSMGDGRPDQYLRAEQITNAADWNRVYALQVNLLFRSQGSTLSSGDEARVYLGRSYEDRFVRQVVSSTFRLRNRF